MMRKRPVIGITTQTLEAVPDQLPRCWVMSQRYVHVLVSNGAVPWIVPLLSHDAETLRSIYDHLDGVFLPGGVDMDPSTYDEPKRPECGRTDPPRDATEIQLLRWAMEDRKPVLAVCRGVQVMNVAAGGSLYQDLDTDVQGSIKHDYFPSGDTNHRDQLVHDIRVERGTRLATLLGSESVTVNSMHHQGIKKLAPTMVATAYASDGIIEGAEARGDHFMVGVQWHPEDLTDADARMRRLFGAFVDAACDHRDAALLSAVR
jgi:putative glutamine amidotransferase